MRATASGRQPTVFETYGVTGVALIAFLALALVKSPSLCAVLIIWLFVMRALMIVTVAHLLFSEPGLQQCPIRTQEGLRF